MKDLKEVAGLYSKAIDSVKKARERLSEVVIKYIIENGVEFDKCTEYAISENLGLPRSTVRAVLADLEEEGILEAGGLGRSIPYTLNGFGIGIALDWKDMEFSKGEINGLLSAKETEKEFTGSTGGSPFYQIIIDGKKITRYRGNPAASCLETLTGRFMDFVDEALDEKLKKAFGDQTLKRLDLLLPELRSFETVIASSPFPAAWITKGLQVKEDKITAEVIKRTVIDVYERNLKFALRRLRKFASLLEDKGYEGMHASFKGKFPHHNVTFRGDTPPNSGWRFHDEYLWTTTLALREGCKIGDEIGADPTLLKEVRTLADVLDMALERKYAGMKAEGQNLMDWGQKQSSKI